MEIDMDVSLNAARKARISGALRSRNSEEIKNSLPYLNTYILSKGSLNRDAFSDVLKSQSKIAIESIIDLEKRLNEFVFKEGCINREAFRAVLRSRNNMAITIIKQHLNTYIHSSGSFNRLAFSGVLKSQSREAIESIINLKKCLKEYVLAGGYIDHGAFNSVLRSRNKTAIELVTPYLNHLDQYILNPDGSVNPTSIRNILSSRCKAPIKKILPYLDEYVMPIPGKINPERIEHVLNSYNADAINKIFEENYLTAYVKLSDKPGECLKNLHVNKYIYRRIKKDLKISKKSKSSTSQSDPVFEVTQQPENIVSVPMISSNAIEDDSISLGCIDSLIDSCAIDKIFNTDTDVSQPCSSQAHREDSSSQLTENEVEQPLETFGGDRFSNSILSSPIQTESYEKMPVPIARTDENRFDGVSIFSFYPPNVSDQSEDEKEFITLRG
jgi:hypothetical protein